jgi:Ca-activated chloride channel family protein
MNRMLSATLFLILAGCMSMAHRSSEVGADAWAPIDDEIYAWTRDRGFVDPVRFPLSTFAIDVDTASYSNVRRHLQQRRRLPPPEAVRIEELINAFDYSDPPPTDGAPLAVHATVGSAPWMTLHRLVRVAIVGTPIVATMRPDANLVFLVDVSGSMSDDDKLPLVQRSLHLLLDQLEARDRVAIITYAASAKVVLASTPVSHRGTIQRAIDDLHADGATNGSAGIELAYEEARSAFIFGGVNRVILASDGDFNQGSTEKSELERLIRAKARSGIFLSVLGFGQGNLNDSNLETLADRGNGHYAYVDSLAEARRVLATQLERTLLVVAKNVKVQVEFNPSRVAAYRLIGYENRRLHEADFANDAADGGELGAGATTVALYEILPRGAGHARPGVEGYRYRQTLPQEPQRGSESEEMLVVKVRYQDPFDGRNLRIELPVMDRKLGYEQMNEDFRFTAAVAAFGMLLRNSPDAGGSSWPLVEKLAPANRSEQRSEFRGLVRAARRLSR